MHDPTPDRPRRSPGLRRASRTERGAASGARGARVEPSAALTPIEAALADAFEALAAAGVPVLALRGARDAPQYRGGHDLDLTCRPRDLARLRATLLAELRRLGVVVVSEHRQPFLLQLQLYAACGPGRHHHLCVGVHTAETCYGIPFLDAEELLTGARVDQRPMRPAAAVGALLDFLTPYLSARFVDPEYGARLEVVAETHPALLRSLLGRLVGTRRTDRFVAALRDGAPAGALAREAAAFRRALLGRAVLRQPLTSARGLLGCVWSARVTPLVLDRWLDDWHVDPARSRMRPASRYVRWLTRLASRPDVTLVASARLRTVRARKREVNGRECPRRLQAYEDFARHRGDVFVISTLSSIEGALDRAQYALFFRIQPMIPELGRAERTLPEAERRAA